MHTCRKCGRRFEGARALKMHIRDRHYGYYFAKYTAPWIALVAVIGLAAVTAFPHLSTPRVQATAVPEKEVLLNTYLTGHEKLELHIHQTLKIFVDGSEVKVPANIGILPDGRMRVIHTHDETGVIHVESPRPAEFTFGDFLKIWGKALNSTCFDRYCGKVRFTANGVEIADPINYVLKDRDELVLEITTG